MNLFGDEQFRLVEQAGDRTAGFQQADDRFPHHRVVAAQNGRAAGLQEVDVLVSVFVVKVGTLRLFEADRERLVERQVMLDAARYVFPGLFKDGFGSRTLFILIF